MVVFLKQYGAERTGTNLLRALLTDRFDDVVVLMHVLGDKHSSPVDLARVWQHSATAPDRAWEFVRCATLQAPAITTDADDVEQMAYLQGIAATLATAVASERLGYVISVKDPYAWAVSILRWYGRLHRYSGSPDSARTICAFLREQCCSFNQKYGDWLALHDRFRARSFIVRYEDMMGQRPALFDALERYFALKRKEASGPTRLGEVLPTHWDQHPSKEHRLPYDLRRYESRDNLRSLSPLMRDTVTTSINWHVMKCYGYTPLTVLESA